MPRNCCSSAEGSVGPLSAARSQAGSAPRCHGDMHLRNIVLLDGRPVLFDAMHPMMHILYKHEIDRIPILARAFRMGGFIPVDRRNKEAAMRSIEAGARSIRSGNSFLIFPEGTRSRTGDLLPFKKGGFIMAIKAQAPIVPVAITGGRAAMKRGSPWIYPVRVTIKVGQPIETAGVALDERDELIDRVRTEIAHLLRSLHESSVGHTL